MVAVLVVWEGGVVLTVMPSLVLLMWDPASKAWREGRVAVGTPPPGDLAAA